MKFVWNRRVRALFTVVYVRDVLRALWCQKLFHIIGLHATTTTKNIGQKTKTKFHLHTIIRLIIKGTDLFCYYVIQLLLKNHFFKIYPCLLQSLSQFHPTMVLPLKSTTFWSIFWHKSTIYNPPPLTQSYYVILNPHPNCETVHDCILNFLVACHIQKLSISF